MTKIAIISQAEEGVLVDVSGCNTLQEATQHLTYTLQVSSQFWEEQPVDLNLGKLTLTRDELSQVLSTLAEVNVKPRRIYADSMATRGALRAFNITPSTGKPASFPVPVALPDAEDSTTCGAEPEQAQPSASAAEQQAAEQPAALLAALEASAAAEQSAVGESGAAQQQDAHLCAEAPATTCGADETTLVDGDPATATVPSAEAEADSSENAAAETAATPPKPAAPAVPHVLYLRQTLRSGQAVSHKGHLIIIGDVNPGAEVIAEGDITIWGALRGIAHAGVGGNTNAQIRALRFDPIQLRIAQAIARSPDRPRGAQKFNGPETARIVNGTIRISSSAPE